MLTNASQECTAVIKTPTAPTHSDHTIVRVRTGFMVMENNVTVSTEYKVQAVVRFFLSFENTNVTESFLRAVFTALARVTACC